MVRLEPDPTYCLVTTLAGEDVAQRQKTLATGESAGADHSETAHPRCIPSQYLEMSPLNDYARLTQHRYDAGLDFTWYPREHR
jgi:hypothetical protein